MIDIETIGVEFKTDGLKAGQRELDKTTQAANRTADAADNLSRGTQRNSALASSWGIALKEVAANARLMAAATAGIAASMTLMNVARVQREFDVLNASLVTVTGGSVNARLEFAWLKEFAATTPYGLNEVTQGFVKMKALGLDPSRAALTSYGNTASAMGKSLNQMVEAVADAATGEFERLKEFGIKAKQQGDQVSLTFQGVTKTIGNNAAEITQYLQSIGNNEFGGAMAERAKTLDGLLSNLGDTWDELYRTVSTKGVGSIMYDSVTLTNAAVGDAISILNALNSATSASTRETGALKAAQEALAVVFETIAVLGVNVKYTITAIGTEIGGIAAQLVALASLDFKGFSAIGQAMRDDAEAARREVEATTARILGARRLAEIAQSGVGMDEPRFARLLNATNAQAVAIEGVAKASKEAMKAADEYQKLMDRIYGKHAGTDPDFVRNLLLIESQGKKTGKTLEQIRKEQQLYIAQQPYMIEAEKARIEIAEQANRAWDEYFDLQEKARLRLENGLRSGREIVEQLEFEAKALRMTNTEREIAIRLRQLEAAGLKVGSREYEIMAERIRSAVVGRDLVQASIDAQNAIREGWAKTSDQMGQSFINALMQGGQSVKEYLEGLFRAMVLQPVLAPVGSVMSGLVGSVMPGGNAMAGTGGGAGNLLSGLGSIGNLASSISSFGAGIMSGISEAALGASFVGPSASLAAGATGAGASVGSALSAIPGWGWAAAGVMALLGSGFGKTPGEQHTGGFFSSSGASGMDAALGITNGQAGWARDLIKRANPEIDAMVKNTVGSVIESTTAQAKALGMDIAVGIDAGFAANTNGKGKNKNAFGYFDVTINGETVAEYVNRTLGEDVTKATAQWTSDMTDAVAEWVLGGKDLIKSGETAGQALARLSTNLTSVNSTFDVLGYKMFDASVGGAALASSLVDAFGSLERFTELTGQFYQSYYSDSERFATSQRLLRDQFAALNMAMPDSTAGFRAMVESAQAAGNNALLSNLLELGPAFYAVANAVEDVFNSISATTAQSVRDIEMSILGDAEKYQYLDREIEGLITKLSAATLPAEIQATFEKINQGTLAAWNLLNADQQKGAAASYIDRLYEAEAIAQSRLSVTGNQATTEEAQAKAVQDMRAVVEDMRKIRDSEMETATMNRRTAELNLQAAQTTKTIQLVNQYGQAISSSEVVYS